MADNTTLNPGVAGDIISTDDIGGGVKVQRVKIQHGADGSATDVSTASPLPISDAGSSVTVDGTVTVQDGGSAISVDDNGGSLTVDVGTALPAGTNNIGDVDVLTLPAIPAGSNEIGRVRITDGTTIATVRELGANDALNVALVDASGNQITSLGTEYTEDAVAAANPTGPMLIARRRDTPTASEVSNDGDNIALITTAEGYLRTAVSGTVNVADGGGLLSVDDGGGTLSIDDGGGSITVDGTLTVTGIGSGATDLGKAEDASHVSGDVGILALAVRRDTPTSAVNADGDYTALSTDSTGALRVTGGGGGTQYTEDAVAATDPVGTALIMVRADTLAAVTSTDGDNVAARATNKGELYVKHADTLFARLVDNSGNDVSDDPNNSLRVSIVSGGGSGGTAMADDAAFTVGTTNVTPVAGTYKSTRDSVDDNDAGALAMTQKRGLYVSPETPAGDSLADDTADALKVVGAVGSGVALSGGPLVAGARSGAAAPSDVGSDGAAVALRATRKGELFVTLCDTGGDSCMDGTNDAVRVSIVNGGGTGGTAMTDDAAFTPGSTQITPVAGTYRASRDQVDDGDAGAFAMTQRRALYVTHETPAGDQLVDDTINALQVRVIEDDATGRVVNDTLFNLSLTAVDAAATVATKGRAAVAFELQGTFVATLQFEGSIDDGATWFSVRAFVSGSNPAAVTSATATGRWYTQVSGLSHFRVRCSAYTSGTVSVWIGAGVGNASQGLLMVGDGGLSLTVDGTVNLGTPVTVTDLVTHVDDAAFTPGTTRIAPVGGTYRITRDNLDDGDAGCVALTQKRAQRVCLEDASANDLATGNGANTNSLRVTVANDSTGIIGVSAVTPGTTATSLGKAEDAAHADGDTGVAMLAVRRDTAAVGSGTDGDYSTLNVNSTGRLYTATTIDAALPAGTNNIGDVDVLTMPATVVEDAASAGGETSLLIAGVRNDAAASKTSADGDFGNIAIDSAGRVGIADLGGSITVDGTVGVSGTVTTQDSSSLVDNAGFTDGTSRVLPAGFIFDETAGTALTENDVAASRIDSKRAQVGTIEDATTRGQRVAVNAGGALEVHGDVAHDAAVSGNPVLMGLEARTAVGTAVANGDLSRALADVFGKQVVVVGAFFEEHLRGSANFTNTTAADIIAAQGAGIKIAVMGVLVTNAHATVGTKVTIRDKTTTTKKIVGHAAAVGGGFAPCGASPLLISDANSAIEAVCGTTGADVDVNVWGFLIKN